MGIGRRGGIALGAAGVVAAGAVWAGAGGASAGSDELGGWGASEVGSVAAAVQLAEQQTRNDDRDSTRLVLRSEAGDEANIDVGEAGESPGDYFLFEEQVFARHSDRLVGRLAGRCELGITTFTCEGTLRVNGKGKIRVAGTFFADADTVIPVTGGTGDFRDVGGQMRVFGTSPTEEVLVLRLKHLAD